MWLKLVPDYHPPSADRDSSLGGILPTAFGGWKLFPSVYFLRNFSIMKYRLNGRIFTPGPECLDINITAGGGNFFSLWKPLERREDYEILGSFWGHFLEGGV